MKFALFVVSLLLVEIEGSVNIPNILKPRDLTANAKTCGFANGAAATPYLCTSTSTCTALVTTISGTANSQWGCCGSSGCSLPTTCLGYPHYSSLFVGGSIIGPNTVYCPNTDYPDCELLLYNNFYGFQCGQSTGITLTYQAVAKLDPATTILTNVVTQIVPVSTTIPVMASTAPTTSASTLPTSTMPSPTASTSTMSTPTTSTTTSATPAPAAAAVTETSPLSTGAIVGIAICGVVVIALIIGGLLWFYKLRKKKDNNNPPVGPQQNLGGLASPAMSSAPMLNGMPSPNSNDFRYSGPTYFEPNKTFVNMPPLRPEDAAGEETGSNIMSHGGYTVSNVASSYHPPRV